MRIHWPDVDLTKYEGCTVTLKLGHQSDCKQYAQTDIDGIDLCGWLDRIDGEQGTTTQKTIREMYFVQHQNGGRGYGGRAKRYAQYFSDEVKRMVIQQRVGGMLARMFVRGDMESADIMVYFTDCTILDTLQFIPCPEEWYSEQYQGRAALMLERGFYDSAEQALAAQRQSDDMFGERFFPVAAFPVAVSQNAIDQCIWRPKVVSDAIRTPTHVIYGSRCKQHEVGEFVEAVYEHGGAIIRGTVWDW